MSEITRILSDISDGNREATNELLPVVYDELRKLANYLLGSEKPGQTLQATVLVHEAYLKLVGKENNASWENRGHFFGAAAEAMRRLLVEQARRKKALRHGGAFERVNFELGEVVASNNHGILDLDLAIDRLEKVDSSKAELVKLRYFAGLTNEQAAAALGIGVSTAERHWAYARSWLRAEINRLRNS